MIEMNFYWWTENNRVVVQNMVMGAAGQKHTHTKEEFKVWRKDVPAKNLIRIRHPSKAAIAAAKGD